MAVKFHEKAIAIYGVAQSSENSSAVKTYSLPGFGTISATSSSTAVTGVNTKFLSKVNIGDKIYTIADVLVGTIASITSDTALVLTANSTTALSAVAFNIGQGATVGTITTTGTAVVGTGTAFLTDLTVGGYIFTTSGLILGKVASVSSNTAAVLSAVPSAVTQSVGVMGASGPVTAVHYNTGLGPDNALAVLNLNYSQEILTESFQWAGDETSRDEVTEVKDRFAKFDFETFLPALGTIAGSDPVVSEVPMADWMQSSGFAVVLSTGAAGFAKFTNSVSSNSFLTIEVRRSSPDLAVENVQKTYTISDSRGLIDFTGMIGTKAKMKFNFLGNLLSVKDKISLVPNYSDQKGMIAPTMKSSTITLSEITTYADSGVEPSILAVSNICFDKLSAPNLAGFEYTRYQLSCFDSWDKGAVPSDVTITILEDRAESLFNPDSQIENAQVLTLRFGNVTGKKIALIFHKLVLAKTTNSKIAKSAAQDLNLRNAGTTDIILS